MASDKGIFSSITERIKEATDESLALVIAYAKQETLDPIKSLGNFLLYGSVGSLFLGFGTMLWMVALLRVLQEETAVFHGNWTWVPYLIVAAVTLVVMAVSIWRITAGPAKRRIEVEKGSK